MNSIQRFSSDPSKFVGRFKSLLSFFKTGIPHSGANTHFIWAIAVLLVVIFAALYIDIKSNNETILRTNLIKSTSIVAENIELHITNASSGISGVIAQIEQKGNHPLDFEKFANDYLNANPDADLIRLIDHNGRGLQTITTQDPAKTDAIHFDYLNYPAAIRDALKDAFRSNRITISSYFHLVGDPSSNVAFILPFKMDQTEYGFLVRISLTKLLASSIPNYLKSEFDFSLMHGFDQIAGNSPYSPVDDFTIPSYIRPAEPLPPSIQLYGCNIVDTPIILASPLLFWLGILLLFLLMLLFFLNKKIKQNQKDLETATD
ncbi:MAG: hypothetical protein LUC43_00195 [Burkholderiales bacterium]|nr:hypothetical protein [Burkholderiales bacterium]